MTNSVTHRRSNEQQSAKPEFPGGIGGARRDRTDDLKLAKLPLSQLSYGPLIEPDGLSRKLVGLGGFEPPTSRLSSARSNQLSYRPKACLEQQKSQDTAKEPSCWPRMRDPCRPYANGIERIRPEKKEKRRRRSSACRGLIWPLCSKRI